MVPFNIALPATLDQLRPQSATMEANTKHKVRYWNQNCFSLPLHGMQTNKWRRWVGIGPSSDTPALVSLSRNPFSHRSMPRRADVLESPPASAFAASHLAPPELSQPVSLRQPKRTCICVCVLALSALPFFFSHHCFTTCFRYWQDASQTSRARVEERGKSWPCLGGLNALKVNACT